MKSHLAEYVSPGHPDRLADAIVESVVDYAVSRDPEALVGVECAVHTDHVFLDGRIAAGWESPAVERDVLQRLVRLVYRKAGYGPLWRPDPARLTFLENVCLEPLSDDEREIRELSDDQNVVVGYACNHPETDYLPPAHFIANFIGRRLDAWRRTIPACFGPDFKVLVNLEEDAGHLVWKRLTLNLQHHEKIFATEQHARIRPLLRQILAELESRGLAGIADLPGDRLILNGLGDFIVGGPEGDNGLSGKKLVVDFYGPDVPIGGGAICGKDPHKVDVVGAFRARALALRLLKEVGGEAVRVHLGWTPGDAAPACREAERIDSLGLAHPIPAERLPPEKWFQIKTAVAEMHLTEICRRRHVLEGYLFDPAR